MRTFLSVYHCLQEFLRSAFSLAFIECKDNNHCMLRHALLPVLLPLISGEDASLPFGRKDFPCQRPEEVLELAFCGKPETLAVSNGG